MKRYKIFLASSGELSLERKEIALMIARLNNKWTDEKDVYLELVVWEDLLHSFREGGERIQDYFNREMLKCDIVIALFYRKVGQFTEEEFKLAYNSLKNGNKPHFLLVYFKSGSVPIEEIDEELLKIGKLKKEIQGYEQIYRSFNTTEDLILKLQHQLELVISEEQDKGAAETQEEKEEKARNDFENYKQHLSQKFRYLDFTGLNSILQKPLELENIYVNLRAIESLPIERFRDIKDFERLALAVEKENKPKKKDKDFVTLFKRLYRQKQKERQALRMLILGHPGSGKTTLMKWIALQCLKTGENVFFSLFTPVFISLKDLGRDPDNTFRKKNIVNLVIDHLEKENISAASFLDEQMKANRLLFLLDGLDEIGDEKIRREAIDWIQKQYIYNNSLIVTSRFSGIDEAEGLKFRDEMPVFEIRDFDMKDIDAFLQNWYRNVEIAVAGERDMQKAIEEGDKKHRELIAIIRDDRHKSLRELAVNPLLLTIIAIVHRTRAVLPRDRHKLYEECLKVMIELWNLSNRKIDVSFSFDNSMSLLSMIAKRLMETERREMDKKEIEECLPETIENRPRDFFLKEMVLKAGLLYESEGKIGFLHLTFQEYLAARYYAKSKDQNEILAYREKDYWTETFKLFVNIANAHLFFKEIIANLMKKEYWQQMNLWEDCLKEIVEEKTREEIEKEFAREILNILPRIEYKEKNEPQIIQLHVHYPLYKYAGHFVKKGWNLFNHALHPFVRSVGSSILNQAGKEVQAELIEALKARLNEFEKQEVQAPGQLLDFLYRDNNSFLLLLTGRRNVRDFHFALAKLKSCTFFIVYLDLLDFRDVLNLLDLPDFLNLPDLPDLLDLPNLRFLRYRRYRRDLPNLRFLRFRDPQDILGLRYLLDQFLEKYKTVIETHNREIVDWADKAIEKLHGLSDKELLKYFPGTTREELKEFRENGKQEGLSSHETPD